MRAISEISDGTRMPVAPIPITVFAMISAIGSLRSEQARAVAIGVSRELTLQLGDEPVLWADQGKHTNAHDLLTPIYRCFTEGCDTRDLKEAAALFAELA